MNRSEQIRLALWIVAIAASAVIISRTRFTADISAFLPRAPSAEQRLLVDQLSEGPAARLLLLAIEGADVAERARLSRKLAEILRKDPRITVVVNGDALAIESDRAFLFDHRYLLSGAVNTERFSAAGMRDAIHETIELLASPVGLLAKSLVPRDPTGELLQILDRLDQSPHPASAEGVWVSGDGRRALLLARTAAQGSDTDAQERVIADIRNAFHSVAGKSPVAAVSAAQLRMSGPAVFAVEARATIRHEAVRLSLVSSALILTLLLLVYRSGAALILGLLPVFSGVLAGVAAVALGFGVVHGITLGFGITLIGESVDYSIYLFIQSRTRASTEGAGAGQWIQQYWPTVRLGVLTSVVGFLSLLPSAFPGLAQLGLFSVAGLIAAALVTRFVLPSLLPAGFRIRDVTPLGHVVARALRRRALLRAPLLLTAAFSVIVLFLHRDTLWNRDLSALSPVSASALRLDSEMRNDLGAPDVSNLVVVSGKDLESALRAAEAVAEALDRLIHAGVIAGFESPSRLLPSLLTQRERLAALPAGAELRERLRSALAGLPLRAERLEPFVQDVENARARGVITRADLKGTSLAAAVEALLIRRPDGWNALLPLHAVQSAEAQRPLDVKRVRAAIMNAAPGQALLLDIKGELDHLYAGYLAESVHWSLAGLATILVLLLVVRRSLTQVVRIVTPLLLAVLVVAALLVLFGRELTILHLVGMLLIVAVGSNYALFFNRPHEASAAESDLMLASLLIANAATVIGFGVLAFSSVPVLEALGSTVSIGAFLALVFSAALSHPAPA